MLWEVFILTVCVCACTFARQTIRVDVCELERAVVCVIWQCVRADRGRLVCGVVIG